MKSEERIDWFLSSEFLDSSVEDPSSVELPGPTDHGAERYHKTALLGQGGMGRVWLGWDRMLERNVALKEPTAGGSLASRLHREVLLTAKLDHPGVVAVHDIVHDEQGTPLFVMALVRGQTLGVHLRERNPDLTPEDHRRRMLSHLIDACHVLGHAHQRGVLHRDLTPQNILIEDSGTLRVIDWGLAVTLDEARRGPAPAGTPGFMSPEQREGAPLEPSSDVWGLGALLHTVLHETPPPESWEAPEDPSALEAICAKALHPDPQHRYADALRMAEDLRRWFEGRRVEALEMSPWQVARWIASRYGKALILGGSLAFVVSATLLTATFSARREASNARDAEALAMAQRQRADEASTKAREQARLARAASDDLRLSAAQRAFETGNIFESRRILEQFSEAPCAGDAIERCRPPRAVGLDMQLSLIPEPELHHQRTLGACAGTIILTPDPLVQVCHVEGDRFEAWSPQGRLWSVDVTDTLRQLHPSNRVKEWRIDARQLVLRAILGGALSIDLESGEVQTVTPEWARFASTRSTEILSFDAQHWLGASGSSPCPGKLIQAYRHADGEAIYICPDGEVVREREGQRSVIHRNQHLEAHHHVRVGGEEWLASSNGTLWPLGHLERQVRLQGPLQDIFALPETTYLLAKSWGGPWRVLETQQGDWIASFPEDIDALMPSSEGLLQVLRGETLSLWSLPRHEVMRRYESAHGLTDLTWSMDGKALGAAGGGAQVHHVLPFEGAFTPPVSHGRDVMKSITPLRDGGFVAVNALTHEPSPRGMLRFDPGDGRIETSSYAPEHHVFRDGRRVESLANGDVLMLTVSHHLFELAGASGSATSTLLNGAGPFLDLDTDAARRKALVAGPETLRFLRVDGPSYDAPAPEGTRLATINDDGRYAVLTRDALLIFGSTGELAHRIELERAMSVEWRSGHEHILTGHVDGTVRVWHASSAALLAELAPHQGPVSAIACSSEHELAATSSWDTTVQLFHLGPLEP